MRYSQNLQSGLTTTTRDGHGFYLDLAGHYAFNMWQDKVQFLTGVGYRFSYLKYNKYLLAAAADGGTLTQTRHTLVLDFATLRVKF